MKTLKLGICFLDEDDNVITKRVIGTNWSLDLEEDINRKFRTHVDNEIAYILCKNLKLELSEKNILEMIKELHKENE